VATQSKSANHALGEFYSSKQQTAIVVKHNNVMYVLCYRGQTVLSNSVGDLHNLLISSDGRAKLVQITEFPCTNQGDTWHGRKRVDCWYALVTLFRSH